MAGRNGTKIHQHRPFALKLYILGLTILALWRYNKIKKMALFCDFFVMPQGH